MTVVPRVESEDEEEEREVEEKENMKTLHSSRSFPENNAASAEDIRLI